MPFAKQRKLLFEFVAAPQFDRQQVHADYFGCTLHLYKLKGGALIGVHDSDTRCLREHVLQDLQALARQLGCNVCGTGDVTARPG